MNDMEEKIDVTLDEENNDHPLIAHYKEKGLIDERILFFIGQTELMSGLKTEVLYKTMISPFDRINAIGLNGDNLSAFRMKMNHITTPIFTVSIDKIKVFSIEKKFFGKLIVKIASDEIYYEYKITANKNMAFKIMDIINQKGEI